MYKSEALYQQSQWGIDPYEPGCARENNWASLASTASPLPPDFYRCPFASPSPWPCGRLSVSPSTHCMNFDVKQ
jgi:hypothetical protein